MKKIFSVLALSISALTFSQTTLLDESFTSGIPATWSTINADDHTPGVTDFSDAWIGYTTVFDTCAASTSYYLDSNGDEDTDLEASDYLVTPKISLLSFGNLLTWDAKSLDGSFPDGYEVLISTTDSLATSFTTVLKTVDSETPYWTSYSINLMTAGTGYTNQDVYIAFRNKTKAGYVLQIDNVKITGDDPASVGQNEIEFSIYPNPVANILTVEINQFESLEIYNTQGQLLLTSSNKVNNLAYLPKGVYIASVKTTQGIVKKRIIKI
jgi:hypothetical protein